MQVFSSKRKCSKPHGALQVCLAAKSFQVFGFVFQPPAAWFPFHWSSMGSPPPADGRIGFGLWTKPACNLQRGSNIWAISMSIWSSRSCLAIRQAKRKPYGGGRGNPARGVPISSPTTGFLPYPRANPSSRLPENKKKRKELPFRDVVRLNGCL